MRVKHVLGTLALLVAVGGAGTASASVQPTTAEQPESSRLTIYSTRRGDVIVIGSPAADRLQLCSESRSDSVSQFSIIETLDDESVVTSTVTRSGEFRNVRVDLRAGDDTFSFANCPEGSGSWRVRNFTVNGGKGALTYGDETPVSINEVTGNLTIRGSTSSDTIRVASVKVGRQTNVTPAGGDDLISVSGEAGRVAISSAAGNDSISLAPGIGGSEGFTGLRIFSGSGEDLIEAGPGSYGHNPYINTGGGADRVDIGPNHHFTGRKQVITGIGEDYLTIQDPADTDDMGTILASMGGSRDIAYFNRLLDGDVITGNSGVDIACTDGGGTLRAFELILAWTEFGCPPFG